MELIKLFARDDVLTVINVGDYSDSVLLEEERLVLSKFKAGRRSSYINGRGLFHEAMSYLGADDGPLLIGEKGEPLFWGAYKGSLSHKNNVTCVAISQSVDVRSVGIDVEHVESCKASLWSRIFTDRELLFLEESSDGVTDAGLMFSAKESFYKFQYPLTKTYLGFQDVEICPAEAGFEVCLKKDIGLSKERFDVSFCRTGEYVITGVVDS